MVSSRVSTGFNGKRIGLSTNGAGKSRYPHAKQWRWTLITLYAKINSIWIETLNLRDETIKYLEGNAGVKLYDLGFGNGFLHMTPKAWAERKKNEPYPC